MLKTDVEVLIDLQYKFYTKYIQQFYNSKKFHLGDSIFKVIPRIFFYIVFQKLMLTIIYYD